MSANDEIDYMSDDFICTSAEADIRPGLIPKHRRKKETIQQKPVSVKHLEKEKREDGLQTPISADNKGFAMLAKMGFKPGSGLGKSGDGRSEPVPINVKSDRGGLGRNLIRKELMELKANLRNGPKKSDNSVKDYRRRIIEEANTRTCKVDLSKSQKACYNLDIKEGIVEPEEEWFWHDFCKRSTEKKTQMGDVARIDDDDLDEEDEEGEDHYDDDEDNDADEEFVNMGLSVQDKLRLLTLYLRRTYFYCIWCGTQFNDEKDLQQECPGPTREDHA